MSRGVWEIIDTVHAFDNGHNDNQKNEPWNSSLGSLDDRDGRSLTDFAESWETWGTDSWWVFDTDCGDPGD